MDPTIRIYHRIAEIDEHRWDALTAARPFTSHRWLRFCERVQDRDEPFYLVLTQGETDTAAAVFWLRSRITVPDLPGWAARALERLIARRPLLICEIPIADASGLILPEDSPAREKALEALMERALRIASERKAAFLVCGYLPAEQAGAAGWPGVFRQLKLYPGTVLNLTGVADHDGFLSGLSKKQRKNLRRNRASAEAAGAVVTRETSFDPEFALELAENTARKHGGRLPANLGAGFTHLEKVHAHWLVARVGERVVGFDLLVGDRGTWLIKAAGSTYELDGQYFLLTEEDIRLAIDLGADHLLGGTHLYKAKHRLGFETQDNGYVRAAGMGPSFSGILRLLAGFFRL
ncbi:MAG TPA: GNAT family N-acetyltransferase [Anaerolineales bacterium]|nr:GNAT family N-acetyltransferase [Anaerolineales bacterium]